MITREFVTTDIYRLQEIEIESVTSTEYISTTYFNMMGEIVRFSLISDIDIEEPIIRLKEPHLSY